MSTERVTAVREIADEPIRHLTALRDELLFGDPRDENTNVGPVINRNAAERLASMMDDARRQGAQILGGGTIERLWVSPMCFGMQF